jgi:cupin superfamily acireductone dioxygenase involved in methionine salvage
MLYSQLGITTAILDGTADEKTMLSYENRTLEAILFAITSEIERKFLTKTARTQKHAIRFFNEPFRLVPLANMAEIADKFTRNEILTSNEIRQMVGFMPLKEEKAEKLNNPNMPDKDQSGGVNTNADGQTQKLKFRVKFTPETKEKDAEFDANSEEEVWEMLREIGFNDDEVMSVTQV